MILMEAHFEALDGNVLFVGKTETDTVEHDDERM